MARIRRASSPAERLEHPEGVAVGTRVSKRPQPASADPKRQQPARRAAGVGSGAASAAAAAEAESDQESDEESEAESEAESEVEMEAESVGEEVSDVIGAISLSD